MPGSGWFNQTDDGVRRILEFHQGIQPRGGFGLYEWDDFVYGAGAINSNVPQMWVQTETGAGASKAIWVPSATTVSGVVIGVAGATTGNAEELAGKLVGWKPSTMGPIFMEARMKAVGTTTAADGDHFVGFSDVVTATSGLIHAISATSTLTSTGITDGATIGYSSVPSSGALHPASGNNYYTFNTTKATVGATPAANTASIQKDSNYHVFRVAIDTAGNCTFSLDGNVVGQAAAAVTAATALTPYVSVVGQNSHANTGTLDYILVGAATRV